MDNFINEQEEQVDDLQYKGYKIIQRKKGFRFGIDAVLAAYYAEQGIKLSDNVLDIGTGTGIIAILIAARTNAGVTGLEIQDQMAEMAKRSVRLNMLEERVQIISGDIRESRSIFQKGTFSHVITNPPYKKVGSGLLSMCDNKTLSKHEVLCTLEDVISNGSYVLKDLGSYTMVHRPDRLNDIVELMRKYKIEPKHMRLVYPSLYKEPNLILVRGIKGGRPALKVEAPLFVYNEDGSYSSEINKIYRRGELNE